MKSVLISIQPKWVEKIASGEKTIEVRKTAPKCEVPFKCYIYCTKQKPYLYKEANPPFELFLDSDLYKGKGYDDRLFSSKVIGEFICDKIDEIVPDYNPVTTKFYYGYVADTEATCLSEEELQKYGKNKSLYFWHISDLKIYDKPKAVSEFRTPKNPHRIGNSHSWVLDGYKKITRPPQSWCYIEEL